MKNAIYRILSSILIFGLPVLFYVNGYGLASWEYWVVLFGIFFSNILGMLEMED